MMQNVCPRCGSDRITYQTVAEHQPIGCWTIGGCILLFIVPVIGPILGIVFLIYFLTRKRSATITYAVCQDCGFRWPIDQHPPYQSTTAQNPTDPQKTNPPYQAWGPSNTKHLIIIFVVGVCLTLALPSIHRIVSRRTMASSSVAPSTAHTASPAPSAAPVTSRWATEDTPLSDFEYTIDGGTVVLLYYKGESRTVQIPSSYNLDGTAYPVSLDQISSRTDDSGPVTIDSLVISEGISSVSGSIIDNTDAKRLYLPKSLTVLYDNTLFGSYDLCEVYYGGTEEEWKQIFQHYNYGTYKEHVDNGEYYDAGAALGHELNERMAKMDGQTYAESQISKITFTYSADPTHLP